MMKFKESLDSRIRLKKSNKSLLKNKNSANWKWQLKIKNDAKQRWKGRIVNRLHHDKRVNVF